jgi:CheY-like chemotaxis protein
VILDLMLPGQSGLQVLREIRVGKPALPVLVLTAKDSLDERVAGLDAGADDYMIKPFALAELAARLRALLRRGLPQQSVLRVADLQMDTVRRIVRRAPVQVVGWTDVRGMDPAELTGHAIRGAQQVLAQLERLRAADAAGILRDLEPGLRYEVADAMDDDRLADVIQELSEDDQQELLAHLDEARAADILEAMDPDDAADLLAELPEGIQERLLGLMEPEESAPVRRLLQYSSESAGGLMTPEPVVLTPDATIAEALARIRSPDLTPALASMVFVCRPPQATPTGRYLGCVHTQRLLREPPFELVAGALDTEMAHLSPDSALTDVTRFFASYNLVCAPVVDDEDHLLGAVTVDDVLDHLLPDNWRDEGMPAGQTDAESDGGAARATRRGAAGAALRSVTGRGGVDG